MMKRAIACLLILCCTIWLFGCSSDINKTFCIKDDGGQVLLNHTHLAEASVIPVNDGNTTEYGVILIFTDTGTQLFAEATQNNLKKTLRIYVDNEMIANPTVQNKITEGEAIIGGLCSYEEAVRLCKRIKRNPIFSFN